MKKWAAWMILVLALVLVAAGCAQPAPSPAPAAAPTTSAPAPAPTAAPATIVLKMAEDTSPDGDRTDTELWWINEVQKRTNGRVKIQIYWSGSLFASKETLDAAGRGAADMAHISTTYFPDKLPLWHMGLQPGLSANVRGLIYASLDLYAQMPAIQQEFKGRNIELLIGGVTPTHHLIMKTPVKTLADLKGKKIRSLPGYDKVVAAAGAVPISMAAVDVYEAIQRGTVDGVHWGVDQFYRYKLYEPAKYMTYIYMGANCSQGIVINLDTYKKLPQDIQKIMYDMRYEAADHEGQLNLQYEGKQLDFMKQQGLQVISMSDADVAAFNAPAKSIREAYAKELDGKGLPGTQELTLFTQLQAKYEAQFK